MPDWKPHRIGLSDLLLVPAHAMLPADRATAERFLDDALAEPGNRVALAGWLGVAVDDLESPEVRAMAVASLTSGLWRAIEVAPPRDVGRPVMPREPEEPVEPEDPRGPDGPRPVERTWIAVTVVDEDGRGFPRSWWTLTTADGDDRSVRLDDASSWRADDLTLSGTCYLRVGGTVPDPGPPLAMTLDAEQAPWIEDEARASVPLRTGAEHIVVVVRGRTEIVLLDEVGRPEAHEWCEVTVGGRTRKQKTNEQGLLVVSHPRRVESLQARFVLLSAGAVALERSVPLPSEMAENERRQ